MRRTLKREAIRPPSVTMPSEQHVFKAFLTEDIGDRSHAHHGGKPLDSQYEASARAYPSRLQALEYPGHHIVKHVTTVGTLRFNTKVIFIANAFRGYRLGFAEEADGVWSIYFGEILLAKMHGRNFIIRR